MEINTALFTQAEVLKVTRISAKTLQNWIDPSRGILKVGGQGIGRGNRRLYSAVDIMGLVLIGHLVALGVAPTIISALFYQDIRSWLEQASQEGASLHVCRIDFDNEGPAARLLLGERDFKRWQTDHENLELRRFAHIEVNLSDISAYVRWHLQDILDDEQDEAALTPSEKTVRSLRRSLLDKKDK